MSIVSNFGNRFRPAAKPTDLSSPQAIEKTSLRPAPQAEPPLGPTNHGQRLGMLKNSPVKLAVYELKRWADQRPDSPQKTTLVKRLDKLAVELESTDDPKARGEKVYKALFHGKKLPEAVPGTRTGDRRIKMKQDGFRTLVTAMTLDTARTMTSPFAPMLLPIAAIAGIEAGFLISLFLHHDADELGDVVAKGHYPGETLTAFTNLKAFKAHFEDIRDGLIDGTVSGGVAFAFEAAEHHVEKFMNTAEGLEGEALAVRDTAKLVEQLNAMTVLSPWSALGHIAVTLAMSTVMLNLMNHREDHRAPNDVALWSLVLQVIQWAGTTDEHDTHHEGDHTGSYVTMGTKREASLTRLIDAVKLTQYFAGQLSKDKKPWTHNSFRKAPDEEGRRILGPSVDLTAAKELAEAKNTYVELFTAYSKLGLHKPDSAESRIENSSHKDAIETALERAQAFGAEWPEDTSTLEKMQTALRHVRRTFDGVEMTIDDLNEASKGGLKERNFAKELYVAAPDGVWPELTPVAFLTRMLEILTQPASPPLGE